MNRTSTTQDPAGTAISIIGGAGCALFGFMAFGPIGALIMGLVAGCGTKHECTKQVAQELDEATLDNSNKIAEEWLSNPNHRSADVAVTVSTGALIPLPQTRRHHYEESSFDVDAWLREHPLRLEPSESEES